MNNTDNIIHLDSRLSAAASFVRKDSVAADIGTDHGYLPIYALQEGLAQSFLAMDVRKGPLSKAQKNIKEAGLSERVELRNMKSVIPTDLLMKYCLRSG